MAQDNTPSDEDVGDDDSNDGSVSTAAAKFEAMLSDPEDTQVSAALPKGKGKAAASSDDDESPSGDNPLLDDDEDEPAPGVEDEEVDEEDDEPAPPGSRERLVKVTVDGEQIEVPESEVLAGYSRTASFTKKSQALAAEKKAHEANVSQKEAELRAQSEHYNSRLAALEEALQQPEPDWDEIQRTQPENFSNIHAAWQISRDNLGKLNAERQVEQRKLATLAEKARVARVDQAISKAGEVIPEWTDTTEKGKAHRDAVYAYGLKTGFTAQELNGIDDARAIVALNKAYLYDKAVADKKARLAAGKGKVEALTQKKKTLKPGAQNAPLTQKRSAKGRVVADLKARAKKSGSTHDAADAIEAMME